MGEHVRRTEDSITAHVRQGGQESLVISMWMNVLQHHVRMVAPVLTWWTVSDVFVHLVGKAMLASLMQMNVKEDPVSTHIPART